MIDYGLCIKCGGKTTLEHNDIIYSCQSCGYRAWFYEFPRHYAKLELEKPITRSETIVKAYKNGKRGRPKKA